MSTLDPNKKILTIGEVNTLYGDNVESSALDTSSEICCDNGYLPTNRIFDPDSPLWCLKKYPNKLDTRLITRMDIDMMNHTLITEQGAFPINNTNNFLYPNKDNTLDQDFDRGNPQMETMFNANNPIYFDDIKSKDHVLIFPYNLYNKPIDFRLYHCVAESDRNDAYTEYLVDSIRLTLHDENYYGTPYELVNNLDTFNDKEPYYRVDKSRRFMQFILNECHLDKKTFSNSTEYSKQNANPIGIMHIKMNQSQHAYEGIYDRRTAINIYYKLKLIADISDDSSGYFEFNFTLKD